MKKYKLGIAGYGDFTKLMLEYLEPYAQIIVSSRSHDSGDAGFGASFAPLSEVLSQDIIVPSIPSQFLESFINENINLINPKALLIDVCSVKVEPLKVLEELLPKTCQIIGTHPMFGPASVKRNNGIIGLPCVVSAVRTDGNLIKDLEGFIKDTLKLKLIRRTPEQHDQEMAYVQGLSHYIARVMDIMDIPESELATLAYEDLLDMKKIQAKDSWDLFQSIMQDNPYAAGVNTKLKHAIEALDKKLDI